jgi:hypothetical protein
MYRFGNVVKALSGPDIRERHELSGRYGGRASVFLSLENIREFIPEVGRAVAGGKLGLPLHPLTIPLGFRILQWKRCKTESSGSNMTA